MAWVAHCPYCGAPVTFRSVASILAVCEYCRGTLLRKGQEIEGLGKMAALLEDRSPLQLGSAGRWQGEPFTLVGRLQLRYEQGLWSEWHLLFENGQSGWLSEAGGEYVLSRPYLLPKNLPPFADIAVGQHIPLAGRSFTVSNRLTAECVAGEGELPFRVGAGYPAPLVDLRDDQGHLATLDYSDDPAKPLVFLGHSVAFGTLAWTHLRSTEGLATQLAVRAFDCPHCGAPLRVEHADTVRVGCTRCGVLLDTSREEVQLLDEARVKLSRPRIPLGSRGQLRGQPLEVLGYMRRSMAADGVKYAWSEYFCLGQDNAPLWLTEYDGHWNIARVLSRSVTADHEKALLDGQRFEHFQTYEAHVQLVLGEFPWRVRLGDVTTVHDYVAPPRLLSGEVTPEETTWTLAEYIEPAEIAAAFALKRPLPTPKGVFANQPNPYADRQRVILRLFYLFAGAALAIYLLFVTVSPSRTLLKEQLHYTAAHDEPHLTPAFQLEATPRLLVGQDTDLANNWIALQYTLIHQDSGQAWQAEREVSFYAGVEDGESWSEGQRSHEVAFRDLPAGRYALLIEHELDPASPAVHGQLQITRAGPRFSSLLLCLACLGILPLYLTLSKRIFETERWAESDHPLTEQDEDD